MTGFLIFWIYVVGWFLSWRVTTQWFVYGMVVGNRKPDGEDIVFGLIIGAMAALMWPLYMPFVIVKQHLIERTSVDASGVMLRLIGEPAKLRNRRKEAELHEREYRIRQMERELGITSGGRE